MMEGKWHPGPWESFLSNCYQIRGEPPGEYWHFATALVPREGRRPGEPVRVMLGLVMGGGAEDAVARDTARLIAQAPAMAEALAEMVDEFGGSIEQYHKIGPDFTHKDGTEVFHVGVVLDRADLIERARALLTAIKGE